MKINPFNITKAVDYTDEEINSYWVDISEGGFAQNVKPTSPMPMLIMGGKGSGKTHLMRYFSYSLQKLRHQDNFLQGLANDGYLGIYMRCSGLNSNRFRGKGQSGEAWSTIFAYYLELWLSQLVINILMDVFEDYLEDPDGKLEAELCRLIYDLFDVKIDHKEKLSFAELGHFISSLQKGVDYSVNNISLTGGDLSTISIQATPGKLIFGIPQLLSAKMEIFRGVQFLYLIDEYENLTQEQQQHINTLLREKEAPSTFKIGARLYGIKTYKTYSDGEENKENSEYETFNIDEEFRTRFLEYRKFAKSICVKKLNNSNYPASMDEGSPLYINNFFEEFTIEQLNDSLRRKKNSRSYFHELTRDLLSYKLPVAEIDQIIENLTFEEDRFLERTNVFIFFREWSKKGNLVQSSFQIKENCIKYHHSKDKRTLHHITLEKFKKDIIDKLCRETQEPTPYLGLDNFIKMSGGIPRHLLIILKHVFRWSNFNGENPFSKNSKLSRTAQDAGLNDAANWFLEDARLAGRNGDLIQTSIRRLGYFLKEIRFSRVPPECSISSFRINRFELNNDILQVLDYLEQYSYLVMTPERRDKNTNRQDDVYQINGLIAPYFELSISRRGVVRISKEEARIIFTPTYDKEFDNLVRTRVLKYNPPFSSNSSSLFEITP